MKLKSRLINFINLLENEIEYKPLKYYSTLLDVSERTIQNDLNLIKKIDENESFRIDSIPNKGIKLQKNTNNITEVINRSYFLEELQEFERKSKILNLLAIEDKVITYQHLSDLLFVSTSVIVKDIQDVRKHAYGLKGLEIISDRKGTRIKGPEHQVQKFIRKFYLLNFESLNLQEDAHIIDPILIAAFTPKIFDTVTDTLSEILESNRVKLSYSYVFSLKLALMILAIRKKNNFSIEREYIEEIENNLEILQNYPLSYEVVSKINESLDLDLNESDMKYISYFLILHKIELNIYNSYIEKFIEEVVKELIKFVSKEINFDFTKDHRLYNSLVFHIIPMIYRAKAKINISNPLFDQVYSTNPKLFYALWMGLKKLESEYNLVLNNNEISFICIHFQVSFNRSHVENKVYVVCETGLITSELLVSKIKSNLSSNLEVVPISHEELNNLDIIDSNFIISTVDLEDKYEPFIKVNPTLSTDDLRNIFNLYLKHKGKPKLTSSGSRLQFNQDDIFTNMNFESKNDLFRHAQKLLDQQGIIKDGFLESIESREESGSTIIARNTALPHSNPDYANETKMLIYTLEKPLEWDIYGNEVSLVILVTLSDKDKNTYLDFFPRLHSFLSSYKNVLEILNSDKKEVKKLMEEI